MDKNIQGKVVVITGASSGWAPPPRGTSARRGATVVLGARRVDRIEALANELVQAGGKALALATDVTDASAGQSTGRCCRAAHGRIDVIINNAGLMPHSPLERGKIADWDRMIDVNIKGVLYGIAAALPHMTAAEERAHHQRVLGRGPQGGPATRSMPRPRPRCA
jgi:NADP-dependent 3-hydroxy acid dehydrogenase YdfG